MEILVNELIKSAEMIAGKQENIESLGLFVEDDFDMFKSKVKNKIKELENEEGVLVLVDMFGGTPSNASFANLNNLDFEMCNRFEFADDVGSIN
mgnify:CR=1 FL=1